MCLRKRYRSILHFTYFNDISWNIFVNNLNPLSQWVLIRSTHNYLTSLLHQIFNFIWILFCKWNILMGFFKFRPGCYGSKCSFKCRYPNYGLSYQFCACSDDHCHYITGCTNTGTDHYLVYISIFALIIHLPVFAVLLYWIWFFIHKFKIWTWQYKIKGCSLQFMSNSSFIQTIL